MPSPIPEPPALKLLRGTRPGRDSGGRPVAPAPNFRRIAPQRPDWLDEEAAAQWDRVVPGLTRLQLLKPEDQAALARYCEVWSLFRRLVAAAQREDLVQVLGTSGRRMANPLTGLVLSTSRELRALEHEFGLTPSAEGALGVTRDDDGEGNPFDGREARAAQEAAARRADQRRAGVTGPGDPFDDEET